MSSIDSYRESDAADYLNATRKHIAENKSGNTSASNFIPESILEFFNQIDISNAVTLNNNKHEFGNQINISNSFTNTEYPTGLFQITDDAGAGAGVTQPAKIQMSDVG